MTGCATPHIYTKTQREIAHHTQQITNDTRDFIAAAQHLLDDAAKRNNDPALLQAIDIIKKSRNMMNSTVNDGEELSKLTSEKLPKAINEIYERNKKLQDIIDRLEQRAEDETNKITVAAVKAQAVDDYKFWNNFKLYSILTSIGLCIIAIFIYIPASTVRGVLSWIGVTKKTDEPQQRP